MSKLFLMDIDDTVINGVVTKEHLIECINQGNFIMSASARSVENQTLFFKELGVPIVGVCQKEFSIAKKKAEELGISKSDIILVDDGYSRPGFGDRLINHERARDANIVYWLPEKFVEEFKI